MSAEVESKRERRESDSRGPWLVAGVVALLAAGALLEGARGESLFVLAVVLMPAALLVVVAGGRRRKNGAGLAALLTAVLLGVGFMLLLVSRDRPTTDSWWFGLPWPLAVQIAIGVVPVIVLGAVFAYRFDRFLPPEETLETIRSLSDADS